MAWLTSEQINKMGFSAVDENVLLSDKASYYNCKNIRIGNNVRVDDFCVLSAGEGGIEISDHIHIAVYSLLIGAANIFLADYCNISSRVSIYSSSDDFSGVAMSNPMIPPIFTNVQHARVNVGKHVIIGSGSLLLPGVTLEEGVAVGALSMVKSDCKTFGIYSGVPAKRTGERKRGILDAEQAFILSMDGGKGRISPDFEGSNR